MRYKSGQSGLLNYRICYVAELLIDALPYNILYVLYLHCTYCNDHLSK